jgi:FAD:protein FMN transferase
MLQATTGPPYREDVIMPWVRRGLLSGLVFAVATSASADGPPTRYSFTEPHMGTRFKVLLYAPDEAAAGKAAKAAFARVAELDGIMSDYRPTSELMRLCRKAGGDPVRVSPELFFILQKSQGLAKRTDGAFDVTVGPVVRLWRRVRRSQQLPDAEELTKALALVGYDKVKLDAAGQTVQLTKPGMQLDLGGIAKGYAADEALKVLKKHGIDRALVAAGGDIAASGPPPGADGWKVGVAPLEDPEAAPSRFLLLKDGAVSTSGDAEQYVQIGGTRYSHIVDPKTGVGLTARSSVTVVAKDGTTSDSLATAVSVLGAERGLALVEGTEGAAALIVRKAGEGEQTVQSKRFPRVEETTRK